MIRALARRRRARIEAETDAHIAAIREAAIYLARQRQEAAWATYRPNMLPEAFVR